jgi:hypothetical protein
MDPQRFESIAIKIDPHDLVTAFREADCVPAEPTRQIECAGALV